MLKEYFKRNRRRLSVTLISLIGVFIAVGIFIFLVPSRQQADAVNVCGAINTNTSWTSANNPYILTCDVTIESGATLTIGGGVIVRSSGNYSLTVNNGTLVSNGNGFAGVTFEHSSSTSKASWGGIRLNNASAIATLNYTTVKYAETGLHAMIGSATINDSTFDTNNVGVRANTGAAITTNRNKFYKNTFPVALNPSSAANFGSSTNADILGTSTNLNTYNGIGLTGAILNSCPVSGGLGGPQICNVLKYNFAGITNIPYVLDSYTFNITINGTRELRFEKGVIVKADSGRYVQAINGGKLGIGTFGSGGDNARFTSIKDDTIGGDTNNNGSGNSPGVGDWSGIAVSGSSYMDIDFLTVKYAALGVEYSSTSGSSTVDSSTFQNNGAGVYVSGSAAITFTSNAFVSNTVGLRASSSSTITTSSNTFNSNSKYPISIDPGATATLGSGGSADVLGSSGNKNNVNAIGIFSATVTSCPSSNCQIIQRNFAGISNIPYALIDETFVVSGSSQTLTIAQGVRVKFLKTTSFTDAGLTVANGAKFDINGSSGSRVYLTSLYDDTIAGDTNLDSSATSPAQSNWSGLRIHSTASTTSDIDYLEISYAKVAFDIESTGAAGSLTVDNSVIESNFKGAYCRGGYTTYLTSNTIQDNYYGPIFYNSCALSSLSNTYQRQTKFPVAVNADTFGLFGSGGQVDTLGSGANKNGYNAIGLYMEEALNCTGGCSIPSRIFAGINNIPYILLNSAGFDPVSVDSYYIGSGTFTITDPIIIKGGTSAYIQNDGGEITISGDSANRIYFTSEHDDLVGGDTNNNSSATSPSAGDWAGFISSGGPGAKGFTGTVTQFDFTKFKYAETAVTIYSSGSVTINDSDIAYNDVGILVYGSDAVGPTLSDNNIELNETYGIQVANGGGAVSAESTWWGDLSGPLDSSSSGLCGINNGTGNPVTDDGTNNVDYCPFSTVKHNTVALPTVGAVSINSGAGSVNLTEGSTTQISCSTTVTDLDGFTDIVKVTAYLYRSGVGDPTIAALNGANNYKLEGNSQCIPTGGSHNTENYACSFQVQYYADPTDASSPYPSESWGCRMIPFDGAGQGTASTGTIEMNSLLAVNIPSPSIDFGQFFVGGNSGSSNATLTIQNSGNRTIDFQVSSTGLCTDYPTCNGNVFAPGNIQYSTSAFTFGSGVALSSTPANIDVNLQKASDASGGPTSSNVFFGIGVPSLQGKGNYTGKVTINGVGN